MDPVRLNDLRATVPWYRAHAKALRIAALVVVGAAVIGAAYVKTYVPKRFRDPRGVLADGDRARWDSMLQNIMDESGLDVRVLLDSVPAGTDLTALALEEARRVGMGRTSDRRGVFLLVDLATGDLRMEIGPQVEGIFPDGFVGRILRAHTGNILRHDNIVRSLVSTIRLLHHRIREASLGLEYEPKVYTAIVDSTRLAAGAGATFLARVGGPLELEVIVDPEIEQLFPPGATAEEALLRYMQWLSMPVYVPRARFLTPTSRAFYHREFKMTPAYWEYIRELYVGTAMKVVTRGDLAIAYATENPLVTPLFFRRSEHGWEMDTMAELLNSGNLVGGTHSWMLTRQGGDHDRAFADLMVVVGGRIWRFRDGANQPYRTRKDRD
jgi:hypothetical protein